MADTDAFPEPSAGASPGSQADRLLAGGGAWLIEHLPMGVVVQDAQARVLDANPAALKLLRMSLDDLREQTDRRRRWRTTDETGRPLGPEEQPALRAVRSAQVCTALLGLEWADGDRRGERLWLKFTAIPQPPTTPGAGVSRVYSVFEDVTESQRLKLDFQRSEGRYRALVAATSQYVWTNSPEGEMRGEQPDWGLLTGQTPAQYQGYGWAEAVHPDDRQPTIDRWQAAVAARGRMEAEHRVRTRDGTYRTFTVRAIPLLGETGELLEWVGLHTDITPLREAESALRVLNGELEARAIERSRAYDDLARFNTLLLGSAGEGIFGIDRQGRARFTNPAAAALLGYTVEELQGRPMHALIHARHADGTPYPEAECPISQMLAGAGQPQEPRRVEGEVFWRKDGTAMPVEYVVTALPARQDGDGGEEGGVVLLFQDVTAAQAARRALEQAILDLERSNRELEQFAYVSSHDLQEPLRTVGSYAELLGKRYGGQLDARADQYLAFMQDAVTRMRQLINDLLSFSRVGRSEVPMQPVPLAQVMKGVRSSLKAALDETGTVLGWPALPTVLGNEGQLEQLMVNLISNALKFRRPDVAPSVTVQGQAEGGWAHLTVSDNGIGIAPEFQERVFGLFQRLHRREEYPGTGLGLAICRKIVQGHGGELWLESEVGTGTTVHLRLPLAADGTGTTQRGADRADPPPHDPRRLP